MKPTRHIIADLETLDTQPSAVILTAGLIAVEISDTGLTVLSRWYRHIKWLFAEHHQPGRTVSAATWQWWDDQSDVALHEAFGHQPRLPLPLAMHSLSAWLQLHPYPIWGNGSDFDNAILKDAFQQLGMRWPYWRNRCLRTLRGVVTELNPELKLPEWPEHLTKHIAIDDAEYEAHVLAVLLREMTRPKITMTDPLLGDPFFDLSDVILSRTTRWPKKMIFFSTPNSRTSFIERQFYAFQEAQKISSAMHLGLQKDSAA